MEVIIDGTRYTPEAGPVKIGVGITTHNRQALAASTLARIQELTPGAKVVLVDDASVPRVRIPGANIYRFDKNVGIARAKNKCLELLNDCDHIFLFDDDTYPTKPDWYVPYVASKERHLMYLFETWASGNPVGDDQILYEDGLIVAHQHARGCMLYVDRVVLDRVGGMDVRYGKAMNEHLDWSNRIFNAGLTTFHYMDVPGSSDLIHSMDEHQEVVSSIAKIERRMLHQNNAELLKGSLTSSEYAPYGKDVVIACYFAGVIDPQRNERWATDLKAVEKLRYSVEARGYEFVLIHNCFDLPNLTTIQGSPYFERWLKEWQYLRDHPEIHRAFVVDATDVDMLNNPFIHLQPGKLYVGDEEGQTLSNQWMLAMHQEPVVNQYLRDNTELPLLNCGVVGGDREMVMAICRDIYTYGFDHPQEQTEMGAFNYFMHNKYSEQAVYGRHVTSVFKGFERHSTAWWRHK